MPREDIIDFGADDVGEFDLPDILPRVKAKPVKPAPDEIDAVAAKTGYDKKERKIAPKPKSVQPVKASEKPNPKPKAVEHKSVPAIGGVFPHIYERGKPRTQTSIRFPDPVLDSLDGICDTYGLDRWAAINLLLLHFKHSPPK